MTEKEFWLTCADDNLFMKMNMPSAVRDLAYRCWHRNRPYHMPEISSADPDTKLKVAAMGFDTDLFEAYVAAMGRLQYEDFRRKYDELYGDGWFAI